MMIRFAALSLVLLFAGRASACETTFESAQAKAAHDASLTARAHDVITGRIVDLVSLPSPGNPRRLEGEATVAVLSTMKGGRAPGDRIIVPVGRDLDHPACGWELPAVGSTYDLFLAFNAAEGEYRVLEGRTSAKP